MRARLVLLCAALCSVGTTTSVVADQATAEATERSSKAGRLWNLTNRVLTYRIAKTSGVPWSQSYQLAPGSWHAFRLPTPGTYSDLLGLNDHRNPSITVRIPAERLGGVVKVKLGSRDQSGNPADWFFIEDSNGFGRLVQERTREEAEREQTRLKEEPKFTAAELERTKETLRANWVLFDGQ